MDWTLEEPVAHFLKDGRVDRRAELKDRLATVVISGTESTLRWLTMDSPASATAYALFEEKSGGRRWAAVVLTETAGRKTMRYALVPEWENPPYYRCGKRILRMLTKLEPGERPGAEEWRKTCWENAEDRGSSTAFGNLPEGARMIWTVGVGGPVYLPKGKQILLEKTKVRGKWYWKDMDSDAVYADSMIPESDRQILEIRSRR